MKINKSICNRCSKEYPHDRYGDNGSFYFEFGYESCNDGDKVSFDLCPDCLDIVLNNMIKDFKICPDGWNSNGWDIFTDEERKIQFENWKTTGKWDDFQGLTYERLVEISDIFSVECINQYIQNNYPDKPLLVRTN